jgi:hypothetical protein
MALCWDIRLILLLKAGPPREGHGISQYRPARLALHDEQAGAKKRVAQALQS